LQKNGLILSQMGLTKKGTPSRYNGFFISWTESSKLQSKQLIRLKRLISYLLPHRRK